MRTTAVLLLAFGALAACTTPSERTAVSPSTDASVTDAALLARAGDEYLEKRLRFYPVSATEDIGDARFNAALQVDSADFRREATAAFEETVAEVRRVDRRRLSPQEQVSYDFLLDAASRRVEGLRYPAYLMPIDPMGCLPVKLATWGNGAGPQPFTTVREYEQYLERIERLTAWIDQAIANMREGMRRGITQNRTLVERTLPQLEPLATASLDANPFYKPIAHLPASFGAADRERLTREYGQAIAQRVAPAHRKLLAFLRDEYLPHARNTAGIGSLPGGAEWYAFLVRDNTTTHLGPDEIHEMGLREVARIRGEMSRIQQEVGYRGSLADFLRWADARPQNRPFTNDAQILAAFEQLRDRIAPQLGRLFGRLPRSPLAIRMQDSLVADSAASIYLFPSLDGSRPGLFYVAAPAPREFELSQMVPLFLHEGLPGHHLQASLQVESPIPRFRRAEQPNGFVEGWGLYAESLGNELGVYDDPFVRLARLQLELLRAVRLVTDTGLHDKGWSREKTIAYMMETQGLSEDDARRSTERYMSWPGQALSYKVGELDILRLRERARNALGARFDIRDFHDAVLGAGALPLDMLDARIEAWIARANTSSPTR